MKKILAIILIVFLPLYLLLFSVEINTFNTSFYLKSYEKYKISYITGKSLDELDIITGDLLNYLKDKSDEKALQPNFNEREIKHMEDVKILFKYGFIFKDVFLILSILAILILFIYKEIKIGIKGVFYGFFIWWGLILLLALLSMVDFTKYFTYFHLIFFDNDLWLLDPNTDLLIQMLPEEFFISIFKRIVLFFVSFLSIIQIISFVLLRKGNDDSGKIIKF